MRRSAGGREGRRSRGRERRRAGVEGACVAWEEEKKMMVVIRKERKRAKEGGKKTRGKEGRKEGRRV